MTLAVLLDPVGEVAETPVLDLGDGAAMFLDERLQRVIESFGLLRGDILPRNDHVFVIGHVCPLPWARGGAGPGGRSGLCDGSSAV